MKKLNVYLIVALSLLFTGFEHSHDFITDKFIAIEVDPKIQNLEFYWKNDNGQIIKNFNNLKTIVEGKGEQLLFAMNGGMFKKDYSPQGLFIQNFEIKSSLDTLNGNGNFYLKPNGIFFITKDNKPYICNTAQYTANTDVKFATQSGPMLIIDGKIHEAFQQNSKNLNIRNGVGILPDNKVVFAMSKQEINFYDFAKFFQDKG